MEFKIPSRLLPDSEAASPPEGDMVAVNDGMESCVFAGG
jgi:hypothetical protein